MAGSESGAGGNGLGVKKVFLALVFALALYELYALFEVRGGDTISEIIWSTSAHYAILPFAAGVLCGHFFWQRNTSSPPPSSSAGLK